MSVLSPSKENTDNDINWRPNTFFANDRSKIKEFQVNTDECESNSISIGRKHQKEYLYTTKVFGNIRITTFFVFQLLSIISYFFNAFSIQHFRIRDNHKTLPKSSELWNWSSVRFYETDCTSSTFNFERQNAPL